MIKKLVLHGVSTIDGKPVEQVGAGFNRQLLTHLLRGREHFDGFVLSDWGITNDCPEACRGGWQHGTPPAIGMPWGVEGSTRPDRFAKAINAGVDQIGGTEESAILIDAMRANSVTRRRLDEAVTRILINKFRLGLFEQPYVDEAQAVRVVGSPRFKDDAEQAQKDALVLLENRNGILPLKPGIRIYAEGSTPAAIVARGYRAAAGPMDADVILARADAPFHSQHPTYFFGSFQTEGNLDLAGDDRLLKLVSDAAGHVPVVLVMRMQRPAILSQLRDSAAAIVADFGISDDALMDALGAAHGPTGHLPFELPSSMAEVRLQQSSRPHDTAHPLYSYGYGKSWELGAQGR